MPRHIKVFTVLETRFIYAHRAWRRRKGEAKRGEVLFSGVAHDFISLDLERKY
jgi:hypothetical protein